MDLCTTFTECMYVLVRVCGTTVNECIHAFVRVRVFMCIYVYLCECYVHHVH